MNSSKVCHSMICCRVPIRRCFSSYPISPSSTPKPPISSETETAYDPTWPNRLDWITQKIQNVQLWFGSEPRLPPHQRKKIVLLGTGWGGVNFLTRLDISKYDVSVVSPRNYFTFTPLLPSVCAGRLSPRSCLEPVRNKMLRGGKKVMEFYEGWGISLDTTKKSIRCKAKNGDDFELPYDYLVVSVGAEANTFGIPGVAENAHFLKVVDWLERASLPNISEEMKRRLLHFVVVGGGPTGVETAAELADFVREDAFKHFPDLIPFIKITLVEMLPKVLPMFSNQVSQFSLSNLRQMGVDTKMQCRVTQMTKDSITLVDSKNEEHQLECGFVLWASGVGQVPFSKTLLETIPEQNANRVLRVNENLQVIGAAPHLYGLGDCTYFSPEPMGNHVEWLYKMASQTDMGAGTSWLVNEAKYLASRFPQMDPLPDCLNIPVSRDQMTKEEFSEVVKQIDATYKVPPPTAQNANQEGRYLASIFNRHLTDQSKAKAPGYIYRWRGSMAYVGHNHAVMDLPWGTLLGGVHTNFLWKVFYWSLQMSFTNKLILIFDWAKSALRGRDIGRDHSEGFIPQCPPPEITNRIIPGMPEKRKASRQTKIDSSN